MHTTSTETLGDIDIIAPSTRFFFLGGGAVPRSPGSTPMLGRLNFLSQYLEPKVGTYIYDG